MFSINLPPAGTWLISFFPATSAMRSAGETLVIIGLVGEIAILFLPATRILLTRFLSVVCILTIIFGIYVEDYADVVIGIPRSLPLDAQERVAAKLCLLGSQPFNELIVSGSDTLFMGQVENVWKKCHWNPVGLDDRDNIVAVLATSVGIRFLYDPTSPELKTAAKTYSDGLNAEGIVATAEPIPPEIKLKVPTILIVYGSRP